MIFWKRKTSDLSLWQSFVGSGKVSGTSPPLLDGQVLVVARFGGKVATQPQFDGTTHAIPRLDAQVETQG